MNSRFLVAPALAAVLSLFAYSSPLHAGGPPFEAGTVERLKIAFERRALTDESLATRKGGATLQDAVAAVLAGATGPALVCFEVPAPAPAGDDVTARPRFPITEKLEGRFDLRDFVGLRLCQFWSDSVAKRLLAPRMFRLVSADVAGLTAEACPSVHGGRAAQVVVTDAGGKIRETFGAGGGPISEWDVLAAMGRALEPLTRTYEEGGEYICLLWQLDRIAEERGTAAVPDAATRAAWDRRIDEARARVRQLENELGFVHGARLD